MLRKLEALGSKSGKPAKKVLVSNCGAVGGSGGASGKPGKAARSGKGVTRNDRAKPY